MPPSYDQLHHSLIPTRAPSCAAQRRSASLSWPSTVVPQSALARRGHGVHRTTTTLHHREKVVTSRDIITHGRPKDTTTGDPYIANACFKCFQRYVTSFLYGCCKSRSGCCKCFRGMLQMFQEYVTSIYSKCFICFKCMLQVFYLNVTYVSVAIHIRCKCFIWMLHMLQWLYTYVASTCCKYFTCFRRMLQKCFMLQH
jgi:hypothetical protein